MGSPPHAQCGLDSIGTGARHRIMVAVNNAISDPVALHLSDLYRTLSDELALHGTLLALLQEAQESIINRSAEKLLAQVESIGTHLPRLDTLRRHRDHVRRELAQALDQPVSASFRQLIHLLPAELKAHLGTRVTEINSVLQSAQRCLRQNQMLIIRSMEQMDAVAGPDAMPVAKIVLGASDACSLAFGQHGPALEPAFSRRSL